MNVVGTEGLSPVGKAHPIDRRFRASDRSSEKTMGTMRVTRISTVIVLVFFLLLLLVSMLLNGCTAIDAVDPPTFLTAPGGPPSESGADGVCPLTEPAWVKPPEDSAVPDAPEYGHYYVNEDRSIWAGAWWTGQQGSLLRAGAEGSKVGWFRPAVRKIQGR